jgi:hypothetical protein
MMIIANSTGYINEICNEDMTITENINQEEV